MLEWVDAGTEPRVHEICDGFGSSTEVQGAFHPAYWEGEGKGHERWLSWSGQEDDTEVGHISRVDEDSVEAIYQIHLEEEDGAMFKGCYMNAV